MHHTPPLGLQFNFSDDLHASYTSVKALFHLYRRCTCIIHLRQGFISSLQTTYMYHTSPSRLYFIFTDDEHASYASVKALFQLFRRFTCIIHLRQGFISSLKTMYMYHTSPSRVYFILTDDVHASYTSVKALFQLYRRCTCMIHLRQGFRSTLQTMCMHHTTSSRLYFNFTDDVHASYTSAKA